MAVIGAKYPRFAPVATQPDGALPTYTYAEAIQLGKLVKADIAVSRASGDLYADNGKAESVDMFSSGTIKVESDDITAAVAATLYGATLTGANIVYKDTDIPPFGGFAFYQTVIRDSVPYFIGCYYPLVKAVVDGYSASTKTNSINFGTKTTTLNVYRCATGQWQELEEFTGSGAEEACIAWCNTKLGYTTPNIEPNTDP